MQTSVYQVTMTKMTVTQTTDHQDQNEGHDDQMSQRSKCRSQRPNIKLFPLRHTKAKALKPIYNISHSTYSRI